MMKANTSYSQDNIGYGLSGIYNFQTNGIGFGARVEFVLSKRFSAVPQVMYFPAFNKVHEFFGGANLHYALLKRKHYTGYLIGGGSANYWINYSSSHWPKAKAFNVIAEVGGGVVLGKRQLRPFVEYRYNPVWQEGSVHVGLIYFPVTGHTTCPAYY